MKLLLTTQNISVELMDYFERNDLEIFNIEDDVNYNDLDYILIEQESELKSIANRFDVIKNEIQIICLGTIKDYRSFLTYNGRLNIDEDFFKSNLGNLILKKFFTGMGSLHLVDNYSFLNGTQKDFKITNHLSSGIYFDELSLNAFESGYNIVSLRSYMDHIMTYFTYLKQASLAGVPYEIEYAHNDEYFFINAYVAVRGFMAEYMLDSFGGINSKDPMKYLLGIAAKSTDFLEVTYFDDPGRLALTAVWSKEDVNYSSSLAFNNVLTYDQSLKSIDKKIRSYKDVEDNIQSLEKKQVQLIDKKLPGGIVEILEKEKDSDVLQNNAEEVSKLMAVVITRMEEIELSPDDLDLESFNKILNTLDDEFSSDLNEKDKLDIIERLKNKNIAIVVDKEVEKVRSDLGEVESLKEEYQEDLIESVSSNVTTHLDAETVNRILNTDYDEAIVVGGKEQVDESINKVRGFVEDEEQIQRVKGAFEDLSDDFVVKIKSANENDLDHKTVIRSLIEERVEKLEVTTFQKSPEVSQFMKGRLSREIELGLDDYAAKINKTIDSLTESDLKEFEKQEISVIVDSLSRDELISEYEDELVEEIEQDELSDTKRATFELEKSFKENLIQKIEGKVEPDESDGIYKIKNEDFSNDDFKHVIKESLKDSLDENFKLESATKNEIDQKEKDIVKSLSGTLNRETNEVEAIVKDALKDVKKKEVDKVISTINESVLETEESQGFVEAQLTKRIKDSELENKKLATKIKFLESKLQSQKKVNSTVDKLNQKAELSVKNEIENTIGEKNVDNSKRLEIELQHKENLFKSELSKIDRVVKGKDIVIEKSKALFNTHLEQKDKEVKDLQKQINYLNTKLGEDKDDSLKSTIIELKKDNELLAKSAELFKSRLESMAKMKNDREEALDAQGIVDENRDLKLFQSQLKNKYAAAEKELKAWESRLNKSKENERKYKEEIKDLHKRLTRTDDLIEKARMDEVKKFSERAEANKKVQESQDSRELSTLRTQNTQLQKKLKELMDAAKANATVGTSAKPSSKVKLLEKDKKRLQEDVNKVRSDLEKSKKTQMKYKSENTKMKNEIDKYKRDIDKLARQLKNLKGAGGKKAA